MAGAQLCSLSSDYNKYRAVIFVDPLGGIRYVSVRQHRTALDWARRSNIWWMSVIPTVTELSLLWTISTPSSLYKAFPAPEARRIAKRLEIHYTPKHGN